VVGASLESRRRVRITYTRLALQGKPKSTSRVIRVIRVIRVRRR
jgi:hypothetical protein